MNKTERRLKVRDILIRVKTIMVDIHKRGGFIPANIELIENAIEEIDSILTDREVMQDEALYEAFETISQSYKRLRENYAKITGNKK